MTKPNCTEEIKSGNINFGRLGRRVVEGRFDGGSMTSDGGVMLLGEVDRKLALLEAVSRCIADPRSPALIEHGVRDMLRQRVCSGQVFSDASIGAVRKVQWSHFMMPAM
jgi:hypothetical protein